MSQKPRASYIRLAADDRRAALIEAALACISEGGIAAFTVDRICAKAGVSRGLVTHHFGTMNALLAAAYSHIYASALPDLPADRLNITALLDHFFSDAIFNRQSLNIWLALWSVISNNPDLRREHRAQYAVYHAMMADALLLAAPGLPDAGTLARRLICLIDGLGLQHCIDPASMPAQAARQACLDLITPQTGPLA